jgi:hypothetical protein
LTVALFEAGSEFVCFSSDPDKNSPILSVKLFSGTTVFSIAGSRGHSTVLGAVGTVLQAVKQSGITSISFSKFTVLVLS